LYGGAAGGGKSLYLRVSGIRWCELIPGVQVYLFRRTLPDLRDNHLRGPKNILEILGSRIESGEVKYNKQQNEFVWVKTGSRLSLCHCQHEGDVTKYQGAEIHVLLMDELTHFTEYQYRFLRGRLRAIGLNVPLEFKKLIPRIESGANPGGIGHKFVKQAFIHNNPMEIWRTPPTEGKMLRQFIPAKAEDNPILMAEDPEYLDRLDGLGSPILVKAMRDGDWDIFAGQYFSEWNPDYHIYEPFHIPKSWPRIRGIDWGYSDPFCCLWGAIGPDNQIWIYREMYRNRMTDSEYAETINAMSVYEDGTPESFDYTVGDPISFWTKNPETGVARVETYELNGISILKGDNSRISGWSRVREYLQLREYGGRLSPWVRISRDCKNLIKTLPALIHDERRVEDVADGMEDHAPDALRLMLHSRAPQFKVEKMRFKNDLEAAFYYAERKKKNRFRLSS